MRRMAFGSGLAENRVVFGCSNLRSWVGAWEDKLLAFLSVFGSPGLGFGHGIHTIRFYDWG